MDGKLASIFRVADCQIIFLAVTDAGLPKSAMKYLIKSTVGGSSQQDIHANGDTSAKVLTWGLPSSNHGQEVVNDNNKLAPWLIGGFIHWLAKT